MPDLTENALLEALREALEATEDPDGVMTLQEMADAVDRSARHVRNGLVELKKAGRLEVTRVRREALDGTMRPVPGYRIVDAA